MPYLNLSTHRIYYNEKGDGAPLVLLHNGFYSTTTWDPVRDLFAKTFRVIDYDRRGYGRSDHLDDVPEGADIVEEGVAELTELVEKLNLKRINLIGHCLGGAVALLYTARHPDNVRKIVAESVGYFGSLKSLISTDMTFVPYVKMDPVLKQRLEQMHGVPYAMHLWSLLSNHKKSYIMNKDYDIRKEISRIKIPLLIANGDRDFYFEPAHPVSIFKKMRKTAGLWIAPHTGHDMHMESPGMFVETVRGFFK